MTPQDLSALAGMFLSLALAYIPGLNDWYSGLTATHKRLVMLALLSVCAGAAFGLACAGWLAQLSAGEWAAPECTRSGAAELILAWLAALVANQGTYLLLVRRDNS